MIRKKTVKVKPHDRDGWRSFEQKVKSGKSVGYKTPTPVRGHKRRKPKRK